MKSLRVSRQPCVRFDHSYRNGAAICGSSLGCLFDSYTFLVQAWWVESDDLRMEAWRVMKSRIQHGALNHRLADVAQCLPARAVGGGFSVHASLQLEILRRILTDGTLEPWYGRSSWCIACITIPPGRPSRNWEFGTPCRPELGPHVVCNQSKRQCQAKHFSIVDGKGLGVSSTDCTRHAPLLESSVALHEPTPTLTTTTPTLTTAT